MTGRMAFLQRAMAAFFVVFAMVNALIALVVISSADRALEYLVFGVGGLLWLIAGGGYAVAAYGVMASDGRWRFIALGSAVTSAVLSLFAMPELLAHLLLDGAVVVGVVRWLGLQPNARVR